MWFARGLHRIQDWWDARRSLRELRQLQTTEDRAVLDDPNKNPVDLAQSLLRVGERERATECWKDAFARFPNHVFRSHEALRLAVDLGLYEEADMLIRRGTKRRPSEAPYFEAEAELMAIRGDVDGAILRYRKISKRFPNRGVAYIGMAKCLERRDQPAEAESWVRQSVIKFPYSVDCHYYYAQIAQTRGHWEAALERWSIMEELFPDAVVAVLGAAHALDALGRSDEAEARIPAVRHRHSASPEIAFVLARHAMRRKAWEEAVLAWEVVRRRWPDRPEGYQGGVEALYGAGRLDESEQLRAELSSMTPA